MKNVLITGGSGSFGQGFIKLAKSINPSIKKIVIFSRDEMKHLAIRTSIANANCDEVVFEIGDIRDRNRISEVLNFHKIDTVIHAAALKIVPSAELQPNEYVNTNVNGSKNVFDCCASSRHVKNVIAISTDKAVCPVNLYGATKLVMEKYCIAMDASNDKRFSVVRYGNVIGSNASVIPVFNKLIKSSADSLPITDIRMTRFWLSMESAIAFVLDCVNRAHGGEIFVPKIPSMKIVDIAHALAPHLPHKIIGIRAGEKLHESMIPVESAGNVIEFAKHYLICPTFGNMADYLVDSIGDVGSLVCPDFSYTSDSNSLWLNTDEFFDLIAKQ